MQAVVAVCIFTILVIVFIIFRNRRIDRERHERFRQEKHALHVRFQNDENNLRKRLAEEMVLYQESLRHPETK